MRLTSSIPYPLERMKTFLRSHLGSNLVLPQSGFALINSIMSLFDVELNKTQWEHPPLVIRPPPSNKASYYGSDIGGNLLRDSWSANQLLGPVDSPATVLPQILLCQSMASI